MVDYTPTTEEQRNETLRKRRMRQVALAMIPRDELDTGLVFSIQTADSENEIIQILSDRGIDQPAINRVNDAMRTEYVQTGETIWEDQPVESFVNFGRVGAGAAAAREIADSGIREAVDKAVSDSGVTFTAEELNEAYSSATALDAVNVLKRAAPTEVKAISDAVGNVMELSEGVLLTADPNAPNGVEAIRYMTEEELRKNGIDAQLSQRHDQLISQGWSLYFQDGEVIYVNPDDSSATDRMGRGVGVYNPETGIIDGLRALDTRAPIGMPEGTFIPSGERQNVVAGRADAILQDFYEMYGWDAYTDVVNDMDFETILRENVGLSQGLIDLSKRGLFPLFEEFDETSGVTVDLHYQYLAGEQINSFIDMPYEDFRGYQEKFERMGVGYEAPEYGKFDPKFTKLANTAMAYANQNYEADPNGFDKAIADMLSNKNLATAWLGGSQGGGGTARVWRPPAYLSPDYAELSQAVKATFTQRMGRAPSDAEIMVLSDKMKADHRAEFDAEVEAQRLQFFGSGGRDAGTVQDVNYAARFQEDFENKYKDELGTIDRIAMQEEVISNGLSSILSADQAIGY